MEWIRPGSTLKGKSGTYSCGIRPFNGFLNEWNEMPLLFTEKENQIWKKKKIKSLFSLRGRTQPTAVASDSLLTFIFTQQGQRWKNINKYTARGNLEVGKGVCVCIEIKKSYFYFYTIISLQFKPWDSKSSQLGSRLLVRWWWKCFNVKQKKKNSGAGGGASWRSCGGDTFWKCRVLSVERS